MWVVRKYVAYLVFDDSQSDREQSETYAFEPFSNKVQPAVFESQKYDQKPYLAAKKKAKELNQ